MKNAKAVKIFGSLCLVFAVIIFIKGVLDSLFGYRVLQFDPSDDSPIRGFLLVLNGFLGFLFGILWHLPLYFGLAAFYFYGAMGRIARQKFSLGCW